MRPSLPHLPSFGQEVGQTLRLAAPIAVALIAQLGMGVTDTVLLGGLGRDALAAGGLATMLFFFSGSVLHGLVSAVAILVSHARGAGDVERITPVVRAGYVVALLAALPLMVVLWFAEPLLVWIGEPAELAAAIGPFERILLWATPGFMWLATQRAFLSAMARPKLVLAVSIGALFLNGVLCYGLLHGAFGLPKLGYLGSAWASAITIWMQVAAMSLGMRLLRGLPRVRLIGPVDTKIVRELISLGWPIGITVAVEAGVFFAGALVMGTISNAALAAHQIAIQVAALMFMVPMAIGQAANVRVGYHTGSGASRAAQQAGYAALLIGAVVALTAALGIISAPRAIALLFGLSEGRAGDAEVIALASQLLVICAAFQLADGTQAIAAGALRGLKDTRVPMIAAAGGYWAIGFPCAWALAVPFGQGATGVWWGLALGLAVVATLLTWRFARMSSRPLDRFQMESAAREAFAPVHPAAA